MGAEACPGPHREELGEANLYTRYFSFTCLALNHTDEACKCGCRCLETSAFLRTLEGHWWFLSFLPRESVWHIALGMKPVSWALQSHQSLSLGHAVLQGL